MEEIIQELEMKIEERRLALANCEEQVEISTKALNAAVRRRTEVAAKLASYEAAVKLLKEGK